MRKSISFLLAIFAFVAVVPSFVACENEDEDIKQGPQITLTTKMEVGDAIILRFNRDNRPAKVIGAEKIYETLVDMDGGYFESWCVDITYKITSQTIILKGNIASLRCRGNELVGLDVSRCPDLSLLQCEYNQLTTLNVSNNPELIYFFCSYNQLAQLDVSKNTKLFCLGCSLNKINSAEMSKIIKALPDWTGKSLWYIGEYPLNYAKINVVSNNNNEENEISEADIKIAEAKNWKF